MEGENAEKADKSIMQEISIIMMALICHEFGKELTDDIKQLITLERLPALFKLSKQHDLAHLVGDALDKNGLLPDGTEAQKRFLQERNMAIYRYERIQYELDCIFETLEKEKIHYIPLKGSVIREYYPEPWMRTSCDIDILIKEEDLQATIDVLKKELSYRYDGTGPYDANLYSESGVHLELRYNPSAVSEKTRKVLSTIWDNVFDKSAYKLTLTNEMFYFYHMEHMAGHFIVGGCGVRFFLDAYILNKSLKYNNELKQKLLKTGELKAFSDNVEKTAEYWFGNGLKNELVAEIEEYVLYSGIYGCMENRVAIEQHNKGGLKFVLSRIFLPYNDLKFKYPRLQRYPILFPFYQVKRWFNLFNKGRRKKAAKELKEVTTGSATKKERTATLLKNLNLL